MSTIKRETCSSVILIFNSKQCDIYMYLSVLLLLEYLRAIIRSALQAYNIACILASTKLTTFVFGNADVIRHRAVSAIIPVILRGTHTALSTLYSWDSLAIDP